MYIHEEAKTNPFESYLYDEHIVTNLFDSDDIAYCYHTQCESNQNGYAENRLLTLSFYHPPFN